MALSVSRCASRKPDSSLPADLSDLGRRYLAHNLPACLERDTCHSHDDARCPWDKRRHRLEHVSELLQ